MTSVHRIISTVAATSLAAFVLVAPSAHASSARITVGLGSAPPVIAMAYPSVDVPSDTEFLDVTLPAGFDWAPPDINDPAPDVTWAIERAGDVVGTDSGTFGGFGLTGSVDFATLPTAPTGAGYTLHLHAAWPANATLNANDVVDLRMPFDVTAADGGGDVALDMSLDNATTEDHGFAVALDNPLNGGDILQLTTNGSSPAWTWLTGPDLDRAWATRAQVTGGIGVGNVDPMDPTQSLDGPFSVSTPEPETLLVALPDVVYSGANKVAITVTSKTAPATGPVVSTTVDITTSFATGTPRIVMSAAPVMKGSAIFGRTLSVTPGSWGTSAVGSWGSGPLVTSYQWYRGTAAIAGATAATHPIVVADIGKAVWVRVTTRAAGYTPAGFSTPGRVVIAAAAPRMVKAPSVVGKAFVGRVVSARPGTWSPTPTTYRYQWRKNGVAIKGANAATYKLPGSMRGRYLTCSVVTVKSGYRPGVATTLKVLVR